MFTVLHYSEFLLTLVKDLYTLLLRTLKLDPVIEFSILSCLVILLKFSFIFSACGGTFSSAEGVITSPYHPNPYPQGRQCDYLIAQPPGSVINLNFIDFDIEGTYNCGYDYLEIRDGDSENSTLIGRYCGDPTQKPDPISSSMNYLWMRFVTDGSVQNLGKALEC